MTYEERYQQLTEMYKQYDNMCKKYEAGELDITPDEADDLFAERSGIALCLAYCCDNAKKAGIKLK